MNALGLYDNLCVRVNQVKKTNVNSAIAKYQKICEQYVNQNKELRMRLEGAEAELKIYREVEEKFVV